MESVAGVEDDNEVQDATGGGGTMNVGSGTMSDEQGPAPRRFLVTIRLAVHRSSFIVHFSHSWGPATCAVATLTRLKRLTSEIQRTSAARAFSS